MSLWIRLCLRRTCLKGSTLRTNIRNFCLAKTLTCVQQNTEKTATLKSYDDIPCVTKNRFRAILSTIPVVKDWAQFTADMHKKLGPIYSSPVLGEKCVFIANTDAIECLLRAEGKHPERVQFPIFKQQRTDIGEDLGIFFADGEQWYKQRKHANKIFLNPNRIGAYIPQLNEVTVDFIEFLRCLRDQNNTVSLNEEVNKWTFESVGSVFFEKRFDTLTVNPPQESHEFIINVRKMFELNTILIIFPRFFIDIFMRKKYQEALDVQRKIFSIARKHIDEKFQNFGRNSVLEDTTGLLSDFVRETMQSKEDERPSKSELYATLFELMAASVDTTSNTVLFLLYELSRKPELQEKIYQEIKSVAANGEAPTPQMLQETRLLRCCIKEALRLYPVATGLTRTLQEDTIVMGYRVPAGTHVIMSLYTMGRNEKVYARPLDFLPERFLREQDGYRKQKYNPFSSLPFGFGVRMCIGRRFAELEMYVLLFNMLRQFELEYASSDPIKTTTRLVLSPSSDVKVKLIDRK